MLEKALCLRRMTIQGPVFSTPPEHASGIESLVCADIAARQKLGIKKYGVSLAEAQISPKQWLQHAYEEALDLANYLKTLIVRLEHVESDAEQTRILTASK